MGLVEDSRALHSARHIKHTGPLFASFAIISIDSTVIFLHI